MRKEFIVIAVAAVIVLIGYLSWRGEQQDAAINASTPPATAPQTSAPAPAPAQPAAPAATPAAPPAQQ
jgi:hypothetical protein